MKNRLTFNLAAALILLATLFYSCQSNDDDMVVVNAEEAIEVVETDDCETITYAKSVAPIINSTCIECHSTGKNFPNLETFESIKNNSARVKDAVATRRMPRGGSLSQEQIDAIVCWVDNGSLNN